MAFIMLLIFLVRLLFLITTQGSQASSHNISLGSSLTPDTNPSWLSPSGLFAFGFYRQDEEGFAVGIWLATKPNITVVWTANRDDPPVSSNSSIELTRDGWLLLHTSDGKDKNITGQASQATSACMLDSGNFCLLYDNQSKSSTSVIWESFNHPTDTILGGQKLTRGDSLVSSISTCQRTRGNFYLILQDDGNLVAYALNSSEDRDDSYWSTGTFSWSTGTFSWFTGTFSRRSYVPMYLILNHTGSLYLGDANGTYHVINTPTATSSPSRKNEIVIFRATLQWDGNFVLYSHTFTIRTSKMKEEWEALQDPCEAKGICGSNSYCVSNARNFDCYCFPGFLFFSNQTRNGMLQGCYRNFTDEEACIRKFELKLSYHIIAVNNIKLRDHYSYSVMNLSKEACRQSCLDDCNCWATLHANGSCKVVRVPILYAVRDKSVLATVFIKISRPYDPVKKPLPASPKEDAVSQTKKIVYILAVTLGCLAFMCTVMALSAFIFYRVHSYQSISENITSNLELLRDQFTLRAFSFDELQKATDGFKQVIGRNSNGEVYKGFISEGNKAVAVKRLQERMFEGEAGWFRAEITAIAQTHHRNLVRLLGFCIHGRAKKLLVYEFMSNGSLADLLFNAETPPVWKERVRVALDVARGVLYLHEECEARIIHCNITPHNILFDDFWTAKISDFGLSKLLRSNQSGTLLSGDRGTRGYMAPEWHKNTGVISTKVDVYSFGVVLLEILCCRKDMEIDILSTWVYNCFVDKDWNRLMINNGDEQVDVPMFEKMVKVGLLCIQDDPDARPSIKNVILMLEGTMDIPIPHKPSTPSLI